MGPVILFDGVCGLCDRFVQHVLKRDRAGLFRFAPLQSDLAADVLRRHGRDPTQLSTLIVVLDLGGPDERLLVKARAALFVLKGLGGLGRCLVLVEWLPTSLLDWGYDRVARVRYRFWGRTDSCRMPRPEERARFLDVASTNSPPSGPSRK